MGLQFTGLASGLDTKSIIAELMTIERTSVINEVKAKTRLEWKKEAWNDMNKSLYSFYKKELFDFKSVGTYSQKALKNSNESIISLKDSSIATNGSHSIEVTSMAKGSFMAGTQLGVSVSGATTMSELAGITGSATINIKTNTADAFGVDNEITILETDTIDNVIAKIKEVGLDLNVSYDTNFRTLFLSSTETGEEVQLSATGDATGLSVLSALGLDVSSGSIDANAGTNAQFKYNGASLTSTSNNISINGLSFDILNETGSSIIAVSTDTDAIYDKVKEFLTKYNELVADITTKVNADSTRTFNPLTSEEKASMGDDEIKLWEDKIKNSLLRRDDTLTSIKTEMRSILTSSAGVDTTGLNFKYLSDLGIVTGNYRENGTLHIEGDEDDSIYSIKENKLRAAIEADPEGIMKLFTAVGGKLYSSMANRMKSTTLSSSLTFYNNKQIDNQVGDYEENIIKLEERLASIEERYYKQFTAMEQAIQQSNSTGDWLAQQLAGM